MIDYPRSPAELIAALEAEAHDIASPPELVARARSAALDGPSPRSRPRRLRAFIAVAASVLLIVAVAVAVTVWTPDQRHSPPAAIATPTIIHSTVKPTASPIKRVSYNGVEVVIPSSWPVIDGAHAQFTCSSTFSAQTDRVFLGVSNLDAPACPALIGNGPPADGVWMQAGGSTPPSQATTTLPSGQQVYLSAQPRSSSIDVWYHGVSIEIGVGADPAVERSILDSISYHAGATDSAVLGRCPAASAATPTMPAPVRLTSPLVLDDDNGTMAPEPSNIEPKVSAATVWSQFSASENGVEWSIVFGSYSAQDPATINKDGSTTPQYQNVPTWLIQGKGIPTDYGPCGITVYAPYNADTGQSMGEATIG